METTEKNETWENKSIHANKNTIQHRMLQVFLPPEPVAWSSGTWRFHTAVAGILAWLSSHQRVLASLNIQRESCL